MAIFKSGRKWYGKVICDGVVHKLPKSYTNRKDAEEAVRKLKITLRAKKAEDRLSGIESMVDDVVSDAADYDIYANSTILDIWDLYLSLGHVDLKTKAPNTRRVYHDFLKSFDKYTRTLGVDKFRLKDVTKEVVSNYLGWLRSQNLEQARIAGVIWFFRKMWSNLAVISSHRTFKHSPWTIYTPSVRPVTHRQAFTQEEIKAIWNVLDNPKNKAQTKAYPLIKLLCVGARRTGLRKVDLCHLKWSSIHLDENLSKRLLILEPVKTKAQHKEVVIPIADDFYQLLKQQHVKTGHDDYVCREWVSWYKKRYIDDIFNKILKRAGIQTQKVVGGKKRTVLSFHSWRHTAISELAEVGVGEQTIRSIVQHSSIDVHRAYTHVRDEAKAQAIRKLVNSDPEIKRNKHLLTVSLDVYGAIRRNGLNADRLLREILTLKGLMRD